jgi:hypothetical protein
VALGSLFALIGVLRLKTDVGDRVVYDTDDPSRARITRGAAPRLMGAGMIVFGTAFALFGAGFYLLIRAIDLPN